MNMQKKHKTKQKINWYQKALDQTLFPMAIRIGCLNINPDENIDISGKTESLLHSILVDISTCMKQFGEGSIAPKLYSSEKPILRIVTNKIVNTPDLKHAECEVLVINDENNSNTNHSLVFSSSISSNEKNSNFFLKQIELHSDILILEATKSSDNEINEFINQNIELNAPSCFAIIKANKLVSFNSTKDLEMSSSINGKELHDKIMLELKEILLFRSLLKEDSGQISLKNLSDYTQEVSLTYQDVDPDFECQGPIDSLTSSISWRNIFRNFVRKLSPIPKSNIISETTKPNKNPLSEKSLSTQKSNSNCNKLFAQFLKADHLAIYYANAHRSTFILIYCIGAFALINAVLAVAFSEISWIVLTSALAEFFSLAGIYFLYKNDHKKRYHIKWLEYRSLAEMLRMTPLLNSIGMKISTKGFERHQKDCDIKAKSNGRIWLLIYTQILMRWVGFERVTINHENLSAAKSFLNDTLLQGQVEYHKKNAKKMQKVGHKLGHFSFILFVLAFVFVTGKLITKLLISLHLDIDHHLIHNIGHGLGIFAAIFPILGSAAFAIRNHAEFDISSQRSLAMQSNLQDEIETLNKLKQPINYAELIQQINNTSLIMQAETADWLEIYEVKETEPG